MATKEEKEKLIEVLKFTPRTYKIYMWGYGGEKVIGTVEKKVWDYCNKESVNLSDIAWSDEETVEKDMNLNLDLLPFPPGSWYECDDLAHTNGVSRNAGTLQIEDENGDEIYNRRLEDLDGDEDSPDFECLDETFVSEQNGKIVFVGCSNEKGTFFEGEIPLTQPFDISKLVLIYEDIDGEELITGVTYDGEDVDNYGGSTDGKSSDFYMFKVSKKGEVEYYSPEEKDWGHPPTGSSPSTWESSPEFEFTKVKPTIPGWYSARWSSWGTTYGTLYWDGTNFGEWEYGKFKPVEKVDTWSGYNWDTSDWSNQPQTPPDTICKNKKCGWVGMGEQRIQDIEYNDHCPKCNGTEFNWIDYDPDTAKGRKNRQKYMSSVKEK